MAEYSVLKIKSVTLTPNPVTVKGTVILSVDVGYVAMDLYPCAGLADDDNLAGSDYIEQVLGDGQRVYAASQYANYAGEEESICQ